MSDDEKEAVAEQYTPPPEWVEHPLGPPPARKMEDAEKHSDQAQEESLSLPPIPSQPGTPKPESPSSARPPLRLPRVESSASIQDTAEVARRESIADIRDRNNMSADQQGQEAEKIQQGESGVHGVVSGAEEETQGTTGGVEPSSHETQNGTEQVDLIKQVQEKEHESTQKTDEEGVETDGVDHVGDASPLDASEGQQQLPAEIPKEKSPPSSPDSLSGIDPSLAARFDNTIPTGNTIPRDTPPVSPVPDSDLTEDVADRSTERKNVIPTGNTIPRDGISDTPAPRGTYEIEERAEIEEGAEVETEKGEPRSLEVTQGHEDSTTPVAVAEPCEEAAVSSAPFVQKESPDSDKREVGEERVLRAAEGVLLSRDSVEKKEQEKEQMSVCSSAKPSETDKGEEEDFAVHHVLKDVNDEAVQHKSDTQPQASNVAREGVKPLDDKTFHTSEPREPMHWTIPNTIPGEDRKAPVQQWRSEPKPPSYGMFTLLPIGDDEDSKEQRKRLFEEFDMTGTGKLCLAEISKGVRDVLQLDEVFTECKYAVMTAFRSGTKDSSDGLVSKKQFRTVLCMLQSYLDLYKLFLSMTVGETVTLRSWCASADRLAAHGISITQPEADFSRITGGRTEMYFSEFAEWAVEQDTLQPSPVVAPTPVRFHERPLSQSPSPRPASRGLSPAKRSGATHAVQSGINTGGGGGDWTVRFYKGQDTLGAYGDIYQVHDTIAGEQSGVAEGNYLVLQPVIAEALLPVASSLAISKAGFIKKMIGKQYAQILCTDPDARRLFLRSYELLLSCLGITVDTVSGTAVNEENRFHIIVTRRSLNFKKLITRILHSLSAFGLPQFRLPLLSMLVDEMSVTKSLEGCKDVCRSQWIPVLEDGREKDMLFTRLNMIGKKSKAGAGVNAARRARKLLARTPSPPVVRDMSSSRTLPQRRHVSESPAKGLGRAPVLGEFQRPVTSSGKLSSTYSTTVKAAPVSVPVQRPQSSRTPAGMQREAKLPIRLEEDEEHYRLLVLGTPDRVRVVISLMSLQIRILPAALEQNTTSNTVLIDDLRDFCECGTRVVPLASPIRPEAAVKESWGTRHTIFTFKKVPDHTTEL